MKHIEQQQYRKTHVIASLLYSAILVLAIWAVKFLELYYFDESLSYLGLYPGNLERAWGILTMPFLHADIEHLASNSLPLFVLSAGLYYFYRKAYWRIILFIWLLGGIWLWIIGAANSIHIGASGIVYGLAAFHITSGIIRKNKNLVAFAFLVVFLYGSMIWAVFPDFFPDRNISWEGHLTGMIAGIAMAIYYRKIGPQPDIEQLDDDEEDEDDDENAYWNSEPKKEQNSRRIVIHYRDKQN